MTNQALIEAVEEFNPESLVSATFDAALMHERVLTMLSTSIMHCLKEGPSSLPIVIQSVFTAGLKIGMDAQSKVMETNYLESLYQK